jgi:hypothetical protein
MKLTVPAGGGCVNPFPARGRSADEPSQAAGDDGRKAYENVPLSVLCTGPITKVPCG